MHGRWSGQRMSIFMLQFFNKNLIFSLPQFWFGFLNGFSATSFYDAAYLTVFNTVVTACALCGMAILDQDIDFLDPSIQPMISLFMPLIYKETMQE